MAKMVTAYLLGAKWRISTTSELIHEEKNIPKIDLKKTWDNNLIFTLRHI